MVSVHHYVPPGSELPLIICPVLSSLPEVAFVLQERLDVLVHAEGRADAKVLRQEHIFLIYSKSSFRLAACLVIGSLSSGDGLKLIKH